MNGDELQGSRWILTRPRERADSWRAALTRLGAEVMLAPAIRLSASDRLAVMPSLERLPADGLLIFTSATTVRHLVEMLGEDDRIRLQSMNWAAVGPQTAAAIREGGFEVTIEADGSGAEALALDVLDSMTCRPAIHFTSDIGLPIIKDRLAAAGFEVTRVEASTTQEEESLDPANWISEFPDPTGIIFSSPSAVRAVSSRSEHGIDKLRAIPAVAAGQVTAQELREQGWKRIEMAVRSTMEELIQACIRLVACQSDGSK
ncbi:MAG: uroporphyrinogen-III synthase [Planctomycetota bacterium]|nr:uroporphyrinogen-III synthase [Planctomycetota bacterium]